MNISKVEEKARKGQKRKDYRLYKTAGLCPLSPHTVGAMLEEEDKYESK
jgi:hypothetical protein